MTAYLNQTPTHALWLRILCVYVSVCLCVKEREREREREAVEHVCMGFINSFDVMGVFTPHQTYRTDA